MAAPHTRLSPAHANRLLPGAASARRPPPGAAARLFSGRISVTACSNAAAFRPARWHSITVDVRIGTICLGNLGWGGGVQTLCMNVRGEPMATRCPPSFTSHPACSASAHPLTLTKPDPAVPPGALLTLGPFPRRPPPPASHLLMLAATRTSMRAAPSWSSSAIRLRTST